LYHHALRPSFLTPRDSELKGSAMGLEIIGSCENCLANFKMDLIHNGFNESVYAYCDTCGKTAVLSGWSKQWPQNVKGKHGEMNPEMEPFLRPCDCGGRFTTGSSPRCPECKKPLSAVLAAEYIERQAPGAKKGWRWQRNWSGMYCVIVEGKRVLDNFADC
jgi:hypothetical protein